MGNCSIQHEGISMGSTSSREQWETVALAALDSSDPKPAASSHLRGKQSFKAPVHCELSLQFFISSRKTSKAPPHLCSTSAFRSPRVLYVGTFFTAYGEDVLGSFYQNYTWENTISVEIPRLVARQVPLSKELCDNLPKAVRRLG